MKTKVLTYNIQLRLIVPEDTTPDELYLKGNEETRNLFASLIAGAKNVKVNSFMTGEVTEEDTD